MRRAEQPPEIRLAHPEALRGAGDGEGRVEGSLLNEQLRLRHLLPRSGAEISALTRVGYQSGNFIDARHAGVEPFAGDRVVYPEHPPDKILRVRRAVRRADEAVPRAFSAVREFEVAVQEAVLLPSDRHSVGRVVREVENVSCLHGEAVVFELVEAGSGEDVDLSVAVPSRDRERLCVRCHRVPDDFDQFYNIWFVICTLVSVAHKRSFRRPA